MVPGMRSPFFGLIRSLRLQKAMHELAAVVPCAHLLDEEHARRINIITTKEYTPSGSQYPSFLAPKAMNGMDFGARSLNYWVLGPLGLRWRMV